MPNTSTQTDAHSTQTHTDAHSNQTHTDAHSNQTHTDAHSTHSDTSFSLSVANVNYAKDTPNIFEFYSSDLETHENFKQASDEFSSLTLKEFIDHILAPNPQQTTIKFTDSTLYFNDLVVRTYTEEELNQSVFSLAGEGKIYWDGENKAGSMTEQRPNAIAYSAFHTEVPTNQQVYDWYNTKLSQFEEALQDEATQNSVSIQTVKMGILVYDLLCNYIYRKHKLHTVRTEMLRTSDRLEMQFQLNKFNSIIQPLLGNDIIAVEESIDFTQLKSIYFFCFKSYVLPSDKCIIQGEPDSGICLIVNKDLAPHIRPLDAPSLKSSKYLKKTSCFELTHQGKQVLLMVVHMKNPKDQCALVSKTLKEQMDKFTNCKAYDHVIVIGDTNLEGKHKVTPSQFAEMIQLQKVPNQDPTTSKKRTNLQAQVKKADKDTLEEKDACFHSDSLVPKKSELLPQSEDRGSNSIYPIINIDYLPKPEWPSDHKALQVQFVEK